MGQRTEGGEGKMKITFNNMWRRSSFTLFKIMWNTDNPNPSFAINLFNFEVWVEFKSDKWTQVSNKAWVR